MISIIETQDLFQFLIKINHRESIFLLKNLVHAIESINNYNLNLTKTTRNRTMNSCFNNRNSSDPTIRSAPCQETSSLNSSRRLASNHNLLRKVSNVSLKYDDMSKINIARKMIDLNRSNHEISLPSRKKEPIRRSFRLDTNIDMEEIKTSLTNDRIVQISNDGWIEPSNYYSMIDHNRMAVTKDEKSEIKTEALKSFMSAKTEYNSKMLSDNGAFSFWNMSATATTVDSTNKIRNKMHDNGAFSYWSAAKCT